MTQLSGSPQCVLLLSGPLAVGKSTVAGDLVSRWHFVKISSGRFLLVYASAQGLPTDRKGMQALGDHFDEETDYRRLIDDVAAPAIAAEPATNRCLIDAVRKPSSCPAPPRSAFQTRAGRAPAGMPAGRRA
jgi:cytidylate kinase